MMLLVLLVVAVAAGQSLEGEDVKCSAGEGERVEVAGITDSNPCISCYCRRGTKTCKDESKLCPSVRGCYTLAPRVPGECCRRCADCRTNATQVVAHGTRARGAACSESLCWDGVVTQSKARCEVGCPDARPAEAGECCPTCGTCRWQGATLQEGEERTDATNPCTSCTCRGGRLSCRRPPCPVLACPGRLQVTAPGACCPSCSRRHSATFSPPPGKCFFREKLYSAGQSFVPNPCTTCTCSTSLAVSCTLASACRAAGERPSCSHRGEAHAHGARWRVDSCTTCTCKLGRVECSPAACPACPAGTQQVEVPGECCPACRPAPPPPAATEGVCTVFGDPHYKTFDGKVFNFQGSCKYLLTKDCSVKDANSSSAFSIRITNDARDTVAYSWLRTVTVRLGSTKVSLLQRMRVKVDGRRVALPFIKLGVMSVMRDGYRVILRTNGGARLLWDGVSFLELTVPPKLQGRMCGLCGNYNGSPADDLVGRHGLLLQEGQDFGNSWRVGGKRACSVLPKDVPPPSLAPGPCHSWAARARSTQQCAAIRSSLFAPCHPAVPPQFHQAACRTDMCECPGTQCHCEVLTAYARECERKGVRIPRWREETGCSHVTPFKYSGEVVTSDEASTDVNATMNEVVVVGEEEEEEDYALELPVYSGSLGRVGAAHTPSPTVARRNKEKEWRRREKARRKKERRRQKRLKKKRQERRRLSQSSNSLGSFRGLDVVKVAGGGGLRWGGGRGAGRVARPPPFDMLLSSVEEGEERSGELRPPAASLLRRQGRGRLPAVPPPPEAADTHRRDWKRRRS